jgi:hypothetical protein
MNRSAASIWVELTVAARELEKLFLWSGRV